MARRVPFLDRTIPGELLLDPHLRSRARLVQCFYLLGALGFSVASASRYWATGVLLAAHLVSILGFTVGIGVLRLTRNLRVAATLALSLGLGGVIANAIQLGGFVFVLTWTCVLVAGAVYILGLRSAILMGLIGIAATMMISLAHVFGLVPPLSQEALALHTTNGTQAAVMVSVQVVVMLVFLGFYHREHEELNQSLVRARLEAEASSRAKSVFLATMSHEIRTPMNGVLAAADLLRRSGLPAEEQGLAEIVYSSGEALLSLLNDILDFSKIEAGKVQLEALPFAVQELAHSVVELQKHRAREKGLQLELQLAEEVPESLLGDPARLRQILLNLVGNAVKFTDRGYVRLVIAPGTHGISFRVEDTGPGLSEEQRGRLFQPFVQSETSTHRTHGGTGLGLAISRHLVEAMGGHIEVDSEPGRGSVFYFELVLPESDEPLLAVPEEASGDLLPLAGAVLVVDDNEVNRRVAENMLRRLGCTTISANDGAEALSCLAAHSVALILMDRQMPVLDGLEATRRIRELPEPLASTPIVGLTASAFTEELSACLEAGMQDVLSKPVTLKGLKRALLRWGRTRPAPALAMGPPAAGPTQAQRPGRPSA